jgi:UDP-2-acetamido-3-amino-2,3-dideoxy-glucuronate N-acetyltransferase
MSVAKSTFIHSSAVVDEGATVGEETKIWHFCHVMAETAIGKNCSLGQNVFVADNAELKNNVKVQNNVSIYEGVVCEDDVFLGPSMVFTNIINPRSAIIRKNKFKKTHVQQGVSIGANATIICGNTLGKYAFIGAGAVLTKDASDYALMAGVPAKQIGWVSKAGLRLHFNDENIAICPETGEKYQLANDRVTVISADLH